MKIFTNNEALNYAIPTSGYFILAEYEQSTPQDQWEDQEPDGWMWSRGMHYNCWGYEDGGEELKIGMNGGVL